MHIRTRDSADRYVLRWLVAVVIATGLAVAAAWLAVAISSAPLADAATTSAKTCLPV